MGKDKPISVHTAGPVGFLRSQAAALFMAGFCIFFAFIALFVPSKEGPEVTRWIALAAGVGFVVSIVWAVVAYSTLIKKVTIYDDRVEWNDQIATWEDITDVWRTEIIVNGSMQTRQVVIKTHDGTEATFMYILSDWADMAEKIQVETAKVLGPPAFEAYEAGKPVKFGNVVIGPSGVTISGKAVPWTLIDRTTIENGHYCLYQPGEEWSSVSASLGETPNILVLLRLLEVTPKPPYSGPDLRKRG
jgi:hypothetical protein